MNDSNDSTSRRGLLVRVNAGRPRFGARLSGRVLVAASGALGVLLCLTYSHSALTQPATVVPGGGDDFRVIYASADDIAEGKSVAEAVCGACHNVNGVSTTKGVPNLAGQRAVYLQTELRAYQSGARGNTAMNNAVKFLSQEALLKVAAYYGSLEPAQPDVAAGSAAAKPDPVQAGKTAAASCTGCHGEDGVSKTAATPSLAGLEPKYLVAAMQAYKTGGRKSDLMKSMVASAGDPAMNNIALYFALQKPAPARTPAAGDAAAGKVASAGCAGCHGELGVSASADYPSLAGQDAAYLAAALRAYKDGSRKDETMKGMAASLDDAAMKNLPAFYAAQQPQQPNVRKPLTVAEWAQRCDRCHGVNGNSTDPRLPALAAQRVDYLETVLHAYRTGARHSPQMAAMSDVLTEDDVANLAAYYARQKTRAVVYVTIPSK